MEVKSAVRLINELVYRPGWTIEAEDYTKRFEGSVMVKFTFPAYHTERDLAEQGYPSYTDESWAKVPIMVGDCPDDAELYGRVLDCIRKIELHEAREFLRVKPTYWAPFHPHRVDGMRRWAKRSGEDIGEDYRYGVA